MIQCFNSNLYHCSFTGPDIPRLVYSCKTELHHADLPRVIHMHPDKLEVVFIISGEGIHKIAGKNYNTKKGDILIYNAGSLHDEIAAPEKNLSVYCIAVTKLHLPGLEPNHLTTKRQKVVYPAQNQFDSFLSLFELIHQTTVDKGRHIGEINNYLVRAMLIKLYALVTNAPPIAETEEEKVGRKIKEYIDMYYMEDISLSSIAEDLHMSRYYIAHLFKELEGLSPMRYVIRRRIGEAQSMLINTELPVTHIALKVGYRSPNFFHSTFQKIVGLTPKAYRRYWTTTRNE